MSKVSVKTFAIVRDANGAPDMISKTIELEESAYDLGEHYDEIERIAEEGGYEFVTHFDENEPAGRMMANRTDLAGSLSECVHQIQQMQGMFDDADGTIQEALDSAAKALEAYKPV